MRLRRDLHDVTPVVDAGDERMAGVDPRARAPRRHVRADVDESVLARSDSFVRSPISSEERHALWAALISRCLWVRVYYLWRPNLPDEADNHVVELAVAGNAEAIVTHNTRDFRRSELRFPGLAIVTPGALTTGS